MNWFYEDRANCLIVSPLAGSFSLSTKNLEIITTPKNDIYISFVDFFIQVGLVVIGKCESRMLIRVESKTLTRFKIWDYLRAKGYPHVLLVI